MQQAVIRLWDPELYSKAWNFAAQAHGAQQVPGSTRPYITHVGMVAMETMTAVIRDGDVAQPDLAVQCALLHDVLEDTSVSPEVLHEEFGEAVADGVQALTKRREAGDKRARMLDSLQRIRMQPREVWMVKLADRITNLQPPPPHWDKRRIAMYLDEAALVLEQLGKASRWLARRLRCKMERYRDHL